MKPNALKILAALEGPSSLADLARIAGVPLPNASKAVSDLAELGFVRKARDGKAVIVDVLPFSSRMALRDELVRHRRLRLESVARGRRAEVIAGLGFASPAFLRRVTGLSPSSMAAILARLERSGLLQTDRKLRLTIAEEHGGLRTFCQEVCDRECAQALLRVGLGGARVLWSRAGEALLAWTGSALPPRGFKPAAYEAAAAKGVQLHAGERLAIRSRRRMSWADTVLQVMLVPPGGPLNRSQAAIMAAHRPVRDLVRLARWYGVDAAAERLMAFVSGTAEDPQFLPRQSVRAMAREARVSF